MANSKTSGSAKSTKAKSGADEVKSKTGKNAVASAPANKAEPGKNEKAPRIEQISFAPEAAVDSTAAPALKAPSAAETASTNASSKADEIRSNAAKAALKAAEAKLLASQAANRAAELKSKMELRAAAIQESNLNSDEAKTEFISNENISHCAYLLWEQEGYQHGRDREYWFRAEEQLRNRLRSSK